jgi:hypothetical protein
LDRFRVNASMVSQPLYFTSASAANGFIPRNVSIARCTPIIFTDVNVRQHGSYHTNGIAYFLFFYVGMMGVKTSLSHWDDLPYLAVGSIVPSCCTDNIQSDFSASQANVMSACAAYSPAVRKTSALPFIFRIRRRMAVKKYGKCRVKRSTNNF